MKYSTMIAGVLLMLTGCTALGPKYQQTPITDTLQKSAAQSTEDKKQFAVAAPAPAVDQWWNRFGDPAMVKLIAQAFATNHTLEATRANLAAARAMYRYQRGALFPSIDASGSAMRKKTSKNGLFYSGSKYSDYSLAADATWELDFFGRQKFLTDAAAAQAEAAEASLKSVWLSVASEVALRYLDLRTLQARLGVAEDNLVAQKETYDLLKDRYDSGIGDALATYQAEYNLHTTEATIPQLRASIAACKNALALLCGVTPGSLSETLLTENKEVTEATGEKQDGYRGLRPSYIPQPEPLDLTAGIPADAIRQRPDVIVAERNLKAAVDTVGSAQAERYPRFYISGNLGLESVQFGDLLDWDSHFYSFGPGVSLPIFHGGQIVANIEIKTEEQRALAATYRDTVLTAYGDILDALSDYKHEQERLEALRLAVAAAVNAYDIAFDKYKKGLTDFNNVLDSQRNMLSLDESRVISEGTLAESQVKLYKALCGGWTKQVEDDAALAEYFFGKDAVHEALIAPAADAAEQTVAQ